MTIEERIQQAYKEAVSVKRQHGVFNTTVAEFAEPMHCFSKSELYDLLEQVAKEQAHECAMNAWSLYEKVQKGEIGIQQLSDRIRNAPSPLNEDSHE